MVMTRHQRAAVLAAEQWLAQQEVTSLPSLASKVRDAVHWAAAQAGGFTGQRLAKAGVLGILGTNAFSKKKVRH
jgi:hypothetical protein